MGRVKRIWYLSPMRAAKVQASIRAISPETSLLAHTSSESRGTFRQKARSLASLDGWACAVKICHDGMLEDTNSLDVAQIIIRLLLTLNTFFRFQVTKTIFIATVFFFVFFFFVLFCFCFFNPNINNHQHKIVPQYGLLRFIQMTLPIKNYSHSIY